ncbi:MAG: AprI/Inh family metalloprotease inhibitor [Mesorhizobium sp.]
MGFVVKSSSIRVVFLLAASAVAAPALAQSEADFVKAFAGNWEVFDTSFSSGGARCALTLSDKADDGKYALQSRNCGGELSGASKWGIADGQLAVMDAKDGVIAHLGGNQHRISGTTASNKPIVIDRVGDQGLKDVMAAAVKARGCYYLGFSSKCAPESQLANPFSSAPDAEKKINVIVNLNVRAEARDDAGIVGVVPENSCVAVERCLTASDGVWCQAKFGDKDGWIRKVALRQNKWPILTFTNGCG